MSSPSESEANDAILVSLEDVRDFNKDNLLPLPAEDIIKIRKWLRPTPYDQEKSEFSRHLASHLVGTGKWLISTGTYQQWRQNDDNGILWIKGIPGSGKSVMAASIIDQLRKEEVPVLYFFFRQIIDANHQPVAVLRDWLCQILTYSPALQLKLMETKEDRSLDSLSLDDLWKDLKFALASISKVYCVTDALDEMDQGNDDFLHALVNFSQWRPASVKVLITSRPVVTVENPLRKFSIPSIRLEERLVDVDISAYVQYRLRSSPILPEYRELIEKAIPGRANGLFLYAKLSMDAFLEPGADARNVLDALPADLSVMYDDLLREHAKRSNITEDLQLLVLQFVIYATRPLRLLQIAEMVNTVYVQSEDQSLKTTKDLVRATCGPLLEILPDETVSVIHHSFTEFLKGFTHPVDSSFSYPVLRSGLTNQRLAITCLDYLKAIDRYDNNPYYLQRETIKEIKVRYPFLEYAAGSWDVHTRRAVLAGVDMSLYYEALDNFFAKDHILESLLSFTHGNVERGISPLHIAASSGLAQYSAHLFQKGDAGVEAKTLSGKTPIWLAVESNHAETVRVLLEFGADPDGEVINGLKPLHKAAERNNAEVVKILLAAGVNPLTPKTKETPNPVRRGRRISPPTVGDTPFMYACKRGHVETIAEFLPYLDSIETFKQALSWAAESGHAALVDLILRHSGVDVNERIGDGTAIFKACKSGDYKTIEVLLQAGADPDKYSSNSGKALANVGFPGRSSINDNFRGLGNFTALHALCGSRHEQNAQCMLGSLRLLLKAGSDVNLRAFDGSTALHLAIQWNIAFIKPLVDAGADPNIENNLGATILHTDGATDNELLPLLVETGRVDINKAMKETGTRPLHFRLSSPRPESLNIFLAYKPDVNATDTKGNSALHMDIPHEAVFKALLAAGADVNLKNKDGDVPLHVHRARREKTSWLLNAGANIEARNNKGQTPLFRNVANEEYLQLMVNHGARIDTRDYRGRTLLHRCIELGANTKLLGHLVNLDLDPASVDYEGNTLLFELAPKGSTLNIDTWDYLLDLGLDIDQANNAGRTMLHILCNYKHSRDKWSLERHPLGYALQLCEKLNPRDHDGIQPLHLAASVSEIYVFKLLDAGADLFGATNGGMTVLHIAARECQPGVIGIVLSKIADLVEAKRKAFINQQTQDGNAALHYACRSGRPESVKVLLEAGADPNLLNKDGKSPFRECAHFDAEEHCYSKLEYEGTTRLEEIFNMLILHGAIVNGDNGTLQSTFDAAVSYRHEYIVDSLLSLSNRIPGEEPIKHSMSEDYLLCSYRLGATKLALRESGRFPKDDSLSEDSLAKMDFDFVEKLVALRHYNLFEERVSEGFDLAKVDENGESFLHRLVSFGYKDLLARFCSRDAALKFDDHDQCQKPEKDKGNAPSHPSRPRFFIKPLLFAACKAQLPNMDVLKFLVEDIGVNINVQHREHKGLCGSVLHSLAAGHHWWHVAEALPYLIKMGANIELRDRKGRTPLHIALDFFKKGPFYKEAARILVENGADVNAADSRGKTCLSKAGNDLKMTKLLLNHGAEITAVAILKAVKYRQIGVLEELLSRGDNANLRIDEPETTEERERREMSRKGEVMNDNQLFPLLQASLGGPRFVVGSDRNVDPRQVMAVLLKHGADPYATFFKYLKVEVAGERSDKPMSNSDPQEWGLTWEKETHIVIHEILAHGEVVEPLFHLPNLQLELRDPKGRTLLLAAFEGKTLGHTIDDGQGSMKTVFQELLDRGADVTAQDNDGKTILHRIKGLDSRTEIFKILKALLKKTPSLIHLADRDGETALHHALQQTSLSYVGPPFSYGQRPGVCFADYQGLLLDHGADPLLPDNAGNTALHYLAPVITFPGVKELFQRFLDAGVDINARNKRGLPMLFYYVLNYAASSNWVPGGGKNPSQEWHDPFFELFKDAGADFFVSNDEGTTLLHLLATIQTPWSGPCEPKNVENAVVGRFKYLMELGLDPMAEDAQQRTSLDIAAAYGSEHIIKLFKQKLME
ncbi:ankyrin 2-3/unc44 [Penicillium longicatenatum]|uniref:ankyrin 2-3/unc44 n=1 Tax=Penicillium longicatenatum TaxID=1561947 RepID=UPI00254966FE|nr:ankyrin 2-3/unc44 [Penicillium longicatenatum]KAJ5635238.1 ankyrin 2-3/unc44 [Penicillium longicatenatum]